MNSIDTQKSIVLTTPSRGDPNFHIILGDIRVEMDVLKENISFVQGDLIPEGPTAPVSLQAIAVDRRSTDTSSVGIGYVMLCSRKLIERLTSRSESDFPCVFIDMDDTAKLHGLYEGGSEFDFSSIEAAERFREKRKTQMR